MRIKLMSHLAVILFLGMFAAQAVPAQDFGQLLEAVDKLEGSLKKLVTQEADQRASQFDQLQKQIQAINTGGTVGEDLARLQKELAELKAQGRQWAEGGTSTAISESQLMEILNDIEFLKAENTYLRNLMDENSQQLASLDDVGFSPSTAGDPQVERLTQRLTELNSRLEQIVNVQTEAPLAASSPAATMGEGKESEILPGLEISGFFDVINTYQSSADDNTEFGLNQAEIDLGSSITDQVNVEVAVAYNPDDAVFELGAAIIDIHLFGGDGEHVRPRFGIDHSSIIVGQFDVPFGIDYAVYASPDRKLVTAPRVVDITHGGWNDLGVQFALEATHGNLVVFGVNGFESSAEVLDEVETLATGVDVFEEVNTTPANAFGSRLGIAPVEGLEFGSSFAFGVNESDKNEMYLVGGDLQASILNFEFKGEYIFHSLNRTIAKEENQGYYVQTTYSFDRAFVTSRYGSFKPDGAEWIGQMSIGAGYAIADGVELRFETLINENSDDNQNFLQLVAGF